MRVLILFTQMLMVLWSMSVVWSIVMTVRAFTVIGPGWTRYRRLAGRSWTVSTVLGAAAGAFTILTFILEAFQ
jgi:hypothetical protein